MREEEKWIKVRQSKSKTTSAIEMEPLETELEEDEGNQPEDDEPEDDEDRESQGLANTDVVNFIWKFRVEAMDEIARVIFALSYAIKVWKLRTQCSCVYMRTRRSDQDRYANRGVKRRP